MAEIELSLKVTETDDSLRAVVEAAVCSLSRALDACKSESDWRMLGLSSSFAGLSILRGRSLQAMGEVAKIIQETEPGVVDDIDTETLMPKELSIEDKLAIGIRQLQNHIADTIMHAVVIELGGGDNGMARERAVEVCRENLGFDEYQLVGSRRAVRDILVKAWRTAADIADNVYIED